MGADTWAYWNGRTWLSRPASRSPRVMFSTFMRGHPIVALAVAIVAIFCLFFCATGLILATNTIAIEQGQAVLNTVRTLLAS